MTTILLIDDDPIVLRVHEALLRNFGYEVIAKKSTLSALARIQNGSPVDLVITDYHMPVIDGIDFVRALRQTKPLIPVLVLTGDGDVDLDHGLGIFACMSKPVSEQELARSIKAALDHADMRNLLLAAK